MSKSHEGLGGDIDKTVSLGTAANPRFVGIEALDVPARKALRDSLNSKYAPLVNSIQFREQHPEPTIGDFTQILEENIAQLRKAAPGANVADVAQTLDESIRPFFEHSVTQSVADLIKDMEAHLKVLKTVDSNAQIIDVIEALDKGGK